MGRLIDVDEVKKRYPIMRNDFGMVINESLHNDLDKIPTVETISKADMVAILDKIGAEIKQLADKQFQIAMGVSDLNERYAHIQMENAYRHSLNIIDKYKAESEDKG